jgi:hypothetical protein
MKFQVKFLAVALLLVSLPVSVFAKSKARVRAYSYFTDDNKSSQGECDSERKIPKKLKRLKEMTRSSASYMGSEAMEPNGNEESWKHFFSTSASCNESLKKAEKSPNAG